MDHFLGPEELTVMPANLRRVTVRSWRLLGHIVFRLSRIPFPRMIGFGSGATHVLTALETHVPERYVRFWRGISLWDGPCV